MSPIYDVSEALDDELEPIQLYLQSSGEYINGEWVETRDSAVTVQAVIHPMDYSKILKNDPEAPRDTQAIKYWSKTKIESGDTESQDSGDIIKWDNRRWTVTQTKDWKRIGGYYSGIAYLLKGN